MSLATKKVVMHMLEDAIKAYEQQTDMLSLVKVTSPGEADAQNSDDVMWGSIPQQVKLFAGWDSTANTGSPIKPQIPFVMGDPQNDKVVIGIRDMRDESYLRERAAAGAKQQAMVLNKEIAKLIGTTGALFYRTNAVSGYDSVAEAATLLEERQINVDDGLAVVLNSRDGLRYSKDLAGRQTVSGRPEDAWKKGHIVGSPTAGFDSVLQASFLPNLIGGADPATTTTATLSDKPESGTTSSPVGSVTHVDHRLTTLPVVASAAYNIGDKVNLANGGTTVKALGNADKSDTGQAMIVTVVSKPTGTSLGVWPKLIAADDPALTRDELSFANIDTRVLTGATVNRINIDASKKTNIFMAKNSIQVSSGKLPFNKFKEFAGGKVASLPMSNGVTMYVVYDGDIDKLTFTCRLFCWYGITNVQPEANGCFVSY